MMNASSTNKKASNINWGKAVSFVSLILPFLILLLASLAPFLLYFNSGIPNGQDRYYHLLYCEDLLYGFEHGFNGSSLNHQLMGVYAYDTYTFYAPLPHYITVFLALGFKNVGLGVTGGMKIVTLASVFVGGLYVYLLVRDITGRKGLALAAGIAMCFLPYRIWTFNYRGAFSEGVAICFIPMMFFALYRMLHQKEEKVLPFVTLIIAAACLVLSHPFTALVSAVAAVLFLIFDIKKTILMLKKKRSLIYFLVSCVLTVGLVSFFVFPLFKATSSGLYRVSDSNVMWTTFYYLQRSIEANSLRFSGFIDPSWIKYIESTSLNVSGESEVTLIRDICTFLVSSVLLVIIDSFLKGKPHSSIYRPIIAIVLMMIAPLAFQEPAELYLASAIFAFSYIYVSMLEKDDSFKIFSRVEERKIFYRSPEFYMGVTCIIGLLLLIFVPNVWKIVPKIFYNCQFPFRLWGLLGVILIMTIAFVAVPLSKKKPLPESLFLIAAVALLPLSQGVIDKRISAKNGAGNIQEFTYSDIVNAKQIGVQNEYMPKVFYDEDYVSDYSNSLYYSIRENFLSKTYLPHTIEEYPDPVFLTGSGDAEIFSLNTPNVSFHLNVTSETALLQIPQFYYDGYSIEIEKGKEKSKTEPKNVDCLIAFELPQGEYDVNVSYIGPTSYRVGIVFFYLSIGGLVAFGTTGLMVSWMDEKKKRVYALDSK